MSDHDPRDPTPDALTPDREDTDPALGDDPQDQGSFDAIGAAAELDDILASAQPQENVEQHGESYTEILESEVGALSALLEERDGELAEAKDELSRSLDRVEREHQRQSEHHTRSIVLDFLDVLDDLDRALVAARTMDHNPAVIDGVELVRASFMRKLAKLGVSHDPSMGETFDPNLHDAMSVTPVTDQAQHDKVVAVIREGYTLGETVLRPAGVVVGKWNG